MTKHQTHLIEAADQLGAMSSQLSSIAAKLTTHVGGNNQAKTELDAMNQQLAGAAAQLGTPPTATGSVASVPGLQPAKDMTANVAAMHAALKSLQAARTSLVQARTDALTTIQTLGA